MNIVPILRLDHEQPQIDQVQKYKHEYKFIGSFFRTRGLKLYAYDSMKDHIYELKIKYSNTLTLKPIDGKLIPIDEEAAKCVIDNKHEIFKALNLRTATNRVIKYKEGKIERLSNLRVPNENGMNLF